MKFKSRILASVLCMMAASVTASEFGAYYSFEGQGNGFKDTSSNDNNGYFLNSAEGTYTMSGRNGLALEKDVLVVGTMPSHKKDMPITVSAWVRTSELQGVHPLVSKLDAIGNQGFSITVSPQGLTFSLMDQALAGITVSTSGLPSLTSWTHVAVTYSGSGKASGVKVYVNGLEQTTTTLTDNLALQTNTFAPLYIGGSIREPAPFPGAIDEVLIAPTAYSIGQIGCLATFGSDCATAIGLGPRGEQGAQGPKGPAGIMGEAGPRGLQGATGDQGAMGPTGEAGPQGPRGDIGPIGNQGVKGANGANGSDGVNGLAGATGAKGPQGRVGATGPQGDIGATGPSGPKGVTGPRGEQGDTGPRGDAGAQGPIGARGITGATGASGRRGPDGAIGNPGAPGDRGAQGSPGANSSQRGDIGEGGLPATEYYSSAVLHSLRVQRAGANGAQGPVGPQGYPGRCICTGNQICQIY
ncbi:Collagen triple helix repeat [Shewanella denitrificans OS217]|uniref:Collagen triple helix repeat n=1 Tax=Shewanella denitrificans (strain OS217 / ATCC BAA-1090 / DSM 15013) TaxID=318161 RepID=Q12HW9_SHEDO|nr:LamG-like jellyroll fold domain-containing protein [Shewanella denitrificans]ABE56957.1 Collagen triple helix repeat [Shewanella denitrificans OS217]